MMDTKQNLMLLLKLRPVWIWTETLSCHRFKELIFERTKTSACKRVWKSAVVASYFNELMTLIID